jgi:glutamyl-tRNA synthetase
MLHIGGARTALFNWAYARGRGGAFLLRIEDTDPERSRPEFERAILEGLRWVGLEWDEGPDVGGPHAPYRQSERMGLYRDFGQRLLSAGVAYRCFCSRERLEALRVEQEARKETPRYDGLCRAVSAADSARRAAAGEAHVLRFKSPPGEVRFSDQIRGEVAFDNAEIDDWVLVRADGNPTYNFVCVCDDADMGITHVIRGEEHLVNTPKQILLFELLGLKAPSYAHLPLMLGASGKKMSKRDGDTALQDYIEAGFPPEAVRNYLALQGWALDGSTEVFGLEELKAHFDLGKISKGGSIFDVEKFKWFAGEYLRKEPLTQTVARARSYLLAAGLLSAAEFEQRGPWLQRAVDTVRPRVQLYSEIPQQLAFLFAEDGQVPYEEAALAGAKKHGPLASTALAAASEWVAQQVPPEPAVDRDPRPLGEALKTLAAEKGLKLPQLFQPLRLALTGKAGGPELADVLLLLGGRRARQRLEAARARLEGCP